MQSTVKTVLAALAIAMLAAMPAAAQPIKVGTIFPLSGGAGPNGSWRRCSTRRAACSAARSR